MISFVFLSLAFFAPLPAFFAGAESRFVRPVFGGLFFAHVSFRGAPSSFAMSSRMTSAAQMARIIMAQLIIKLLFEVNGVVVGSSIPSPAKGETSNAMRFTSFTPEAGSNVAFSFGKWGANCFLDAAPLDIQEAYAEWQAGKVVSAPPTAGKIDKDKMTALIAAKRAALAAAPVAPVAPVLTGAGAQRQARRLEAENRAQPRK